MNSDRLDVDRELAAISEMDLLRRPYVNAAYATGSLLAGFGTPTSDLDVIVLVGSNGDKDLAKQDGALRRHGSVRADIEVFTVAEFANVIGSCADFRAAWETSRIFRLAPAMRLLSQITAAARILKPSAELTDFRRQIAAQRATLVQLSVSLAVIYGNNTQEDLIGLIDVGDEIGVFRRSHDFLEFGLHAWCTSRGSVYPDEKFKWVWRRLNLVLSSERELAALRDLYVPEIAAPDTPDVARRRADAAQALLAQALLAAWAPDPRSFGIPVLPGRDATDDTLWRSAGWMPTRSPDSWGLGERFSFYEMPVPAVIAWACASGRTSAELEAIVVDHCRSGFGLDIKASTARSAVDMLVERGAIRHAGSRSAAVAEQSA